MKQTEEEKREFWLEQMKMGRASFVLRKGILDWGSTMAAGLFVFSVVSYGLHRWFRYLITSILIAAAGGILVGLNSWYFYQKKYRSSSH
jgi:hypothetical protein